MRIRSVPRECEGIKARDAMDLASRDWQELPEWFRNAYEEGAILFLPDCVALIGGQRTDVPPEDWITFRDCRVGSAPAAEYQAIVPGENEEWG